MTLSEAKGIADSPEGHTDARLRQALDRLRKADRRLSRLNIAIDSNLIRTDV